MARNVLLVEDDRVSRESLAYLLQGLGHEVRAVWSAEEAKTILNDVFAGCGASGCSVAGIAGGCLCAVFEA